MYKKLLEKRADIRKKMEAILDAANAEERAPSDEESAEFDKLEAELKDVSRAIDMELRAHAARMDGAKLVGGDDDDDKDEKKDDDEERAIAEEQAFADYIRGAVSENRADDVNFTKGNNGDVIPASIAWKIIKRVVEISPLYAAASRYNVKGTFNIPYYDENTHQITVGYADEFAELEGTAAKFESITLTGYLAGALSKVSKSLINNSQFDIVSFVINDMAEKFAQWIEGELLNGTTDKIDGLKGITQSVETAVSGKIGADDLIDVQEEIPDRFQGNAFWVMSKDARKTIRKIKNGQGEYLLNKDFNSRWGYTLLGKDVYITDNMSNVEAGKTALYYGDFTGLAVKTSEEINIQVLREKYATQHAVGVVGYMEVDAKVENAQKLAKLTVKA